MSFSDEARYGRACLLLLNVCPFTLRKVIDDYYTKHGFTDLQDFLEKNKYDIYHLMSHRRCCKHKQSNVTPMNRSQWDLLFIKNSSSCRTGYIGDCPCQYDAKPGILSDVMDITLCCLFIKNICSKSPGFNMSHIDTIRTIRNHIIHAESAKLDLLHYNGYWNQVKTALRDLANHVSPTVQTDTLSMIQDLETRVMNAGEFGEIRKVIVDEKRMEVVEESLSNVEKDKDQIKEDVKETTERVTQIEGRMAQTTEELRNLGDTVQHVQETTQKVTLMEESIEQTTEKLRTVQERAEAAQTHEDRLKGRLSQLEKTVEEQEQEIKEISKQISKSPDKDTDLSRLKQGLIKINNNITKAVPILPLQERGDVGLPIKHLFAQVVIREDLTSRENSSNCSEPNREVQEPEDIFKRKDIEKKNDSKKDCSKNDGSKNDGSKKDGSKKDDNKKDDSKNDDSTKDDSKNDDSKKDEEEKDEIIKKVYMLGDAAHGKTTYCIWLLKNWCNAQQKVKVDGSEQLDKWEIYMMKFDFVFILQFSNVDPNQASLTDMICHDVFGDDKDCWDTIHHVLSSNIYRSLIIMDGLDEWNPNEQTRKQLKCQGIPNIHVSSTVSCFFSMRPWVFSMISKLVKVSDRVIEIYGLSKSGMESVIENVLINHYKLKDDPEKYKQKYNNIAQHLDEKHLYSFMHIPLLAVICVQMWYQGKQVADSMTSFYAFLIQMLIERAFDKHKLQIGHDETVHCLDDIPEILSDHEYITKCISLLLKLGKVAYEGLISKGTNLIFQKIKLQKEIGVKELQFSLHVGLISQKEAPSLLAKNVSVHFFHKSIQEFLASVYIVTNKEVSDSLCKHLSNVDVIMELSNVIMFICGMCPSLGSIISKHVVRVTDSDEKICKYRESPSSLGFDKGALYKLQVSWYRELQSGQSDTPVTFNVSDIYLNMNSDLETVRVTRNIMCDHHIDIRSIMFYKVPTDGEHGISNKDLSDFLCNKHNNTRSLVMITIYGGETDRSVHTVCLPSL